MLSNKPLALDINDLENIFDEAVVPMVITDTLLDEPGPRIIYANKAFEKMSGYSIDELLGQTPRILQGEDSDKEMLDKLKSALKKEESFHGQTINYRKDGTTYNVEWIISPVYDKDQKIKYFYSIQKDTTFEVQNNEVLQNILDKINDIIVVTNGEKLTFINESFKEFFEVNSLEEYLEGSDCICDNFLNKEDYYCQKSKDENWLEELAKLPISQRLVSMSNQNGDPEAFQVDIEFFKGSRSIVTFTNITHIVAEKERYKIKAFHDSLTNTHNREFLKHNLPTIIEKSRPNGLGLMLFDIDHFKAINDTYGHNIGDETLKSLVKLVTSMLRAEDYLIRWGGEEFIVICSVKDIEELKKIAEKLRNAVEKENFEKIKSLSISFGITLVQANETLQQSVKRADEALYFSKENGRNQVTIR